MAFEELSSPIPEIKPEDKPDIMAYPIMSNFAADLNPRITTPGMEIWTEFRYRSIGETNHARWSSTIVIDGIEHNVALYGVQGEMPGGKEYGHSSLRCSCCLPDYKSFQDLHDEYHECPAQDLVIAERTKVYRELVGGEEIGAFDDESLYKVTAFLIDLVRRDPLAWPPSHRSDRLLVDPLAEVFGVPKERMRAGAQEMAQDKVIHLHGEKHPSISLAA